MTKTFDLKNTTSSPITVSVEPLGSSFLVQPQSTLAIASPGADFGDDVHFYFGDLGVVIEILTADVEYDALAVAIDGTEQDW